MSVSGSVLPLSRLVLRISERVGSYRRWRIFSNSLASLCQSMQLSSDAYFTGGASHLLAFDKIGECSVAGFFSSAHFAH
jgi:hypothetical protein